MKNQIPKPRRELLMQIRNLALMVHLPLAAPRTATTATAVVSVVLLVLVLVLKRAAHHGSSDRSDDSVAQLVATEATCRATSQSAHQATIAFLLVVWICGAVLLGVRVVRIGSLLRKLARRRAGLAIAAIFLVAAVLLLLIRIGSVGLLAVLESALLRRAVTAALALVVLVVVLVALVISVRGCLRRSVAAMLALRVATVALLVLRRVLLVIALLLLRVAAVALLALRVLVVAVRHNEGVLVERVGSKALVRKRRCD